MFTPATTRAEAPRLLGELRELLRLAVPVAAAQAGIALMGLVDTAVVGRLGAAALGAVGLANGIFFAVAVIGIGTVMGLDPLIAQAFGAQDRPRTRALMWQGAWLALIVSAVLAVPLGFAPGLIDLAGIEPEVARGAKQFLWARLPGLFPLLLFIALRAYLQAAAVVWPLVLSTVLAFSDCASANTPGARPISTTCARPPASGSPSGCRWGPKSASSPWSECWQDGSDR